MTDEERKAMVAAWREWNIGHRVPRMTTHFERGFDAALQYRKRPDQYEHVKGCQGSQIDDVCLGCMLAEDERQANNLLVAQEEIKNLKGENAVLADILRDADKVLETIEADDSDEAESLSELRLVIAYALAPYEQTGGLPL